MCSIILGSRTYDPNHLKISSFNNITDLETENEVDLSGLLLNRFHKVTIKDEQEEVRGNLMFVTYRYYQTKIEANTNYVVLILDCLWIIGKRSNLKNSGRRLST